MRGCMYVGCTVCDVSCSKLTADIYLRAMKYQLGDKILVLHSNEEGEVVDIINDKMVLIDVDGVRFPVYMDQIDFPYFKRFSEKNRLSPGLKRKRIKFILIM